MKKTACVMTFLLLVLTAQAVIVDNFESYTPGTITSPWIVVTGTSTFGQEAGGNKYLQSYGSYLRLDNLSFGNFSIPNSDTETTLFFRVYDFGGTNPDVSAGLCNTATPGATWSDYECQVVLKNGGLQVRYDGIAVTVITTIAEATWYNIWMVINNSADTYDVYVTTGSANATAGDLKADNFAFRNGGTSDLLSFKVYGYSYAPIRVDDISIVAGTDLRIPTVGPNPAVIITDPNDMTVYETQNAEFQTVFTSETSPTVAWYKIASPADLVMDPNQSNIDVQLTYNESSQRYTSVLSKTGLTIPDSGQYYCRINNESGYPRNSTAAHLTVYGLVAHWTLDEVDFVSGQYQDVKSGYNAAAQGTPTFVAGADGSAGGAVLVTPANGWATVDNLNPSETGQLTVSVWINWQETSVSEEDLKIAAFPDDYDYEITVADGLKANNHWQQICAVFNGMTGKVYIDGKLQAQGSYLLPGDMTSLLDIGSSDSGAESFNGALDDLRIYNYAMTDMEVADVYHAMSGLAVCLLEYANQFDFSGPEGGPDCVIDIYDMVVFANNWLVLYDYPEFAELSSNWLSCGLYPDCNP